MSNPVFVAPIEGEDPCGPDLRWDPQFVEVVQAFDLAKSESGSLVVGGELASADSPTFKSIIIMVEKLSKKTKDLRLLAMYVEASWYEQGMGGFAESFEDLVVMLETWPHPGEGIHPRADEDDGDLGERNAPLGKLLNAVPFMVSTIGWGKKYSDSDKTGIDATIKGIFNSWTDRLEPAFGRDLPPRGEALKALQKLLVQVVPVAKAKDGGDSAEATAVVSEAIAMAQPAPVDAWDMIAGSAEAMARQDHHSPAIPVLSLLLSWRSLGITEIADGMKASGVSLEQLLESIKRQSQKKK